MNKPYTRPMSNYAVDEPFSTPFSANARDMDARLDQALRNAAHWRVASAMFGVTALVLAGGIVWQSTRPTVKPYIVEIDPSGNVERVKFIDDVYQATDAQLAHHLGQFIELLRTKPTDPVILRQSWTRAYAYLAGDALHKIDDYARANDPTKDLGHETRMVEIVSVVRQSPESFQVRWRETTYMNGQLAGTAPYVALLTYAVDPRETEDQLYQNPLGIRIVDLSWTAEK
jgi:type IV secretion system protein VirB5